MRQTLRAGALAAAVLAVAVSSASAATLDLATLARTTFSGPAANAVAGSAVGGHCDVSGDRRPDVLTADNLTPSSAYVVYGGRRPGDLDLALLGAPRGFRIVGAQSTPTAAVACAGDVNRDGRDDVLVGSWKSAPNGRANAGTVFVVFGRADGATVDLGALGDRGYRIDGAAAGHRLGVERVASAGDVNGDGRADVLVGATGPAPNGANSGEAWVVFGKATTAPVDLAALGSGGYAIEGAAAGDRAGFAIAPAGDVNGDGRPDQLVGAYSAVRDGASVAGEAYVVFGKRDTGTVRLGDLGTGGITIRSAGANERLGISVAGAGDVNRDGLADVLVGADGTPTSSTAGKAGRAFVIFGRTPIGRAPLTVDTANLRGGGYAIEGIAARDGTGYSVDGIGDVDDDGRADAIVGAYNASPGGRASAGRVAVVFGKASGTPVSLATLTPAQGALLDGVAPGDRLGRAVAGVGAVEQVYTDNDGGVDVAIGADGATALGRPKAGQVVVLHIPDPRRWGGSRDR